jgi:hypothetical protein
MNLFEELNLVEKALIYPDVEDHRGRVAALSEDQCPPVLLQLLDHAGRVGSEFGERENIFGDVDVRQGGTS